MNTIEKEQKLKDIYNQKIIATTEGEYFSIYTMVEEGDDVQELIDKAENQFSKFPQYNKKYQCMTFGKYIELEKQKYMHSCESVTEEKYWEMLEVLPPIYINNYEIPNYRIGTAFIVSERLTSNYYNAYLSYYNKKGEKKYATKVVWRGDKNSYWTEQDLDKLEEK